MPSDTERVALLADPNRSFKEKAGDFLRDLALSFQAFQAFLIFPCESPKWRFFVAGTRGNVKMSQRDGGLGSLNSLFKNKRVLASGVHMSPREKELKKLLRVDSFLASPLKGPGKKTSGVIGVCWKDGKKVSNAEKNRMEAFAQGTLARVFFGQMLAEEALVKSRSLSRLSAMKDDQYQMVVHDLKGPISEIFSNLDLLTYNPHLTEDDREVLDTAICGCDSLYRMVMDLLDINKMEEGKLRFSRKTVRMDGLVEMKVKKMKAVAAQKEITLVFESDPFIPPVEADEELLERVLANLLSNAISYSYPNHPVFIKTEFLKDKGLIQISVQDQGEGIPKSKHKKIFEKFGQSYKSGTRKRHSTGLGLTFCKMAVEGHGGGIWVESVEGKGSTFYFTLPVNA